MASRTILRLKRLQQISIPRNYHHHPILLPILRRCYSSAFATPTGSSKQSVPPEKVSVPVPGSRWTPPPLCPGCGAPSQQIDASLPGYYSLKPRGAARIKQNRQIRIKENQLWEEALKRVEGDQNLLKELGVGNQVQEAEAQIQTDKLAAGTPRKPVKVPEHLKKNEPTLICNRCHELIYHHHAPSLPAYPTLNTLSSLLLSSRHKHNHIYHLIDAADFPLSLRPELQKHLYKTLPKSITRNLTISYIITRCDLLLPKREQVASLITYLKSTLRDFLPEDQKIESPYAKLYAISTRTGWDIGPLKEEISKRQGGVWFLGAVNVGKSTLLRDVWPMGGELRPVSLEDAAEFEILPEEDELETGEFVDNETEAGFNPTESIEEAGQQLDKILTQAQGMGNRRVPQPHVPPTVSDVPGTTAAPIRVSYKSVGRGGKYRGEVVDLPGLERWVGFQETGLMKYVRENRRRALAMKSRVTPEQYSIKPGQSMLIGGLIMITPKTSHTVVLANPFTSIPVHISTTEKCRGFLSSPDPETALAPQPECLFQDPASVGISVTPEGKGVNKRPTTTSLPPAFASAGVFTLRDDVTTKRNPMLQNNSPEQVAKLPYKVLATDILLEGIGWVELTAQVRNRIDTGFKPIEVEVFTPEGKGIGQRKTMSAYMTLEEGAWKRGLRKKTSRPMRSMKGQKKLQKYRGTRSISLS
ncbi:hypothetical protein K440DRAFT_658119 [Wilcoxina mikolae CBS 423.85]|nr:hypothetical protein K440DRAFT_658119 [Wilcoxina mikolae CBS 423.85]